MSILISGVCSLAIVSFGLAEAAAWRTARLPALWHHEGACAAQALLLADCRTSTCTMFLLDGNNVLGMGMCVRMCIRGNDQVWAICANSTYRVGSVLGKGV